MMEAGTARGWIRCRLARTLLEEPNYVWDCPARSGRADERCGSQLSWPMVFSGPTVMWAVSVVADVALKVMPFDRLTSESAGAGH